MAKQTRTPAKKSSSSAGKGKSNTTTSNNSTNNGGGKMDSELEKLFLDSLKDIYYAEKLLTKALPKMSKNATTQELKDAFNEHLSVTQNQVARLEQVFELLGKKAQSKKCEAMEGLKREADDIIEETEKGSLTRDVGLIFAAQKVEHYEIATYGCLRTVASTVGLNEVADLLQQTLDEEKEADDLLTQIAENNINYRAAEEDEEA